MKHYIDCSCEEGKCFNNADPTSGQWVECMECDFIYLKEKKNEELLKKLVSNKRVAPQELPEPDINEINRRVV